MNKDILKGQWQQLKGKVHEQWNRLTDDDVGQVEGSYEKLVGKIQEKYGKSRADAERAVNDWVGS